MHTVKHGVWIVLLLMLAGLFVVMARTVQGLDELDITPKMVFSDPSSLLADWDLVFGTASVGDEDAERDEYDELLEALEALERCDLPPKHQKIFSSFKTMFRAIYSLFPSRGRLIRDKLEGVSMKAKPWTMSHCVLNFLYEDLSTYIANKEETPPVCGPRNSVYVYDEMTGGSPLIPSSVGLCAMWWWEVRNFTYRTVQGTGEWFWNCESSSWSDVECSAKPERCGDGQIQDRVEECDEGDENNDRKECSTDCKVTVCGDGTVQLFNGEGEGEVCDDGNNIDGDGCDSECIRDEWGRGDDLLCALNSQDPSQELLNAQQWFRDNRISMVELCRPIYVTNAMKNLSDYGVINLCFDEGVYDRDVLDREITKREYLISLMRMIAVAAGNDPSVANVNDAFALWIVKDLNRLDDSIRTYQWVLRLYRARIENPDCDGSWVDLDGLLDDLFWWSDSCATVFCKEWYMCERGNCVPDIWGPGCLMPACAAPPEGCRYGIPPKDERGCRIGCGELICDDVPCPLIKCAPPPEGCVYSKVREDIGDGCPSCGVLVCDDLPDMCKDKYEFVTNLKYCWLDNDCYEVDGGFCIRWGDTWPTDCRPDTCGWAGSGCRFENQEYDEQGCKIGCGDLICEGDKMCGSTRAPTCFIGTAECCSSGEWRCPNGATGASSCGYMWDRQDCEIMLCPDPSNRCRFENQKYDQGCQIGCGDVVCEDTSCPLDPCWPPPKWCSYGKSSILDDNGCFACGGLACNES